MVKVSFETPLGKIGEGANRLAITGGTMAVNVSTATLVVVVPVSLVNRKPLTLVLVPAVVAVTLTLTVQDPLGAMVPPVGLPNTKLVAATAGAQVGAPVQLVAAAGVAATCVPAGNASVNVAPVNATLLVLFKVKVNVDTAPTAIGSGAKDFVSVGFTPLPQPVNNTLSSTGSEPGLTLPELNG